MATAKTSIRLKLTAAFLVLSASVLAVTVTAVTVLLGTVVLELLAAAPRGIYVAGTIGLGFVLFAAIFGWVMAARIARPLVALKQGVVAVAQGDFDAQVLVTSNDEIGVLCDAFNQMAVDLKSNQDRLAHVAQHDTLTQLPSRVLIYDRLQQALARARRRDLKAAVVLLGLDRFKTVNDTLGQAAGEQVLQQVSERLVKCLRADDTIGRLGGDEFALILPDLADARDCSSIAEALLQALAAPIRIDGGQTFITASVGVAVFPPDGNEADGLLKNAHAAMRRGKEPGRNNVQFYTSAMNEQALESLELEANLRRALAREEFVLRFQAKVSLDSGQVCGFEALIRWLSADGTLVPPAKFIPVLEQTGLIAPVGEWVLRAACRQIRAWQDEGITPLPIAINLSATQFTRQDVSATVKRVLAESGTDPRLLEIEITESTAMEHAEHMVATLRDLRALGVRISIDDFGTGYSSLSYLKRFPVDSIKIDRSFIGQIADNADDAAIAKAIIMMAHSLQLKVIAEGVETAAQLAFLVSNNCDEVQGYYFSHPVPGAECAAMLKRQHQVGPSEAPGDTQRIARLVDQEDWWRGRDKEMLSLF
ncbi:MAG TPA: EAL domain-containing protein [Burkholderiaceae bacterium]|nr:EAL domain-containing protein [Burkholderiaceae bacterium]